MKMKYFGLLLLIFLSSNCKNTSSDDGKMITAESQNSDLVGTPDEGAFNFSNKEEANAQILKLLQGKWQHESDSSNFLVFEDNHRKEIASGIDEWDDEVFILSNKCINETDADNGIEPETAKYISCLDSDMCWYIVSLDLENLMLSYMGRGNTLSYKRVQ